MRVAILSSSRADYSIYYPLLKKLAEDSFFTLHIIAFGTHLSEKHGLTINQIVKDGFKVDLTVSTVSEGDSPRAIAESMGRTMSAFAPIWEDSAFDIVFCLGDRYEMFAACASSVPYRVKLAHIHGGEQTTGAIDDAFRHAMTHMAQYHFTACEAYRERVIELKKSDQNVYNVGALSLDNLNNSEFYSLEEFKGLFGIDLSKPSVLVTFHPETVTFERNEEYITEIISAISELKKYQFIITMPNADTLGNRVRSNWNSFLSVSTNSIGVESFGTKGYLTCMKHCVFMLGNTSSGYIEASYFPKHVIDLGNRQTGRIATPNIRRCPIKRADILRAIVDIEQKGGELPRIEIYGKGDAASKIIRILKLAGTK